MGSELDGNKDTDEPIPLNLVLLVNLFCKRILICFPSWLGHYIVDTFVLIFVKLSSLKAKKRKNKFRMIDPR